MGDQSPIKTKIHDIQEEIEMSQNTCRIMQQTVMIVMLHLRVLISVTGQCVESPKHLEKPCCPQKHRGGDELWRTRSTHLKKMTHLN